MIAKMSDDQITKFSRDLALNSAVNDEAINRFKLSMFQFDKILFDKTYQELLQKKI